MKDQPLYLIRLVQNHRNAPHFRTRTRSCRHCHHRCNALCISSRPVVSHIFKVPYRNRLSRHQGDGFARIQSAPATKCDNAIVSSFSENTHPLLHICSRGICLDITEYGTTKPFRRTSRLRLFDNRKFRKTGIRYQQRISHVELQTTLSKL